MGRGKWGEKSGRESRAQKLGEASGARNVGREKWGAKSGTRRVGRVY